MTKNKPMLTMVAVLALMLLAGTGSAAFAGPPGNPDTGIKGPPQGNLGPGDKPGNPDTGIKGPPKGKLAPEQPSATTAGIKAPPRGKLAPEPDPCKPTKGIVAGNGVSDCKYPFIAALLAHKPGSESYYQFCGGTLIDSDSVMTAAHCLTDDKTGVPNIAVKDLAVVVGRTQLTSNEGQWREVSRISIPGQWDPSTLEWDVAIVHLKSPVTGITPVRLPLSTANSPEQPGKLLTIAGWGKTMEGGAGTTLMQEAKVPVVYDGDAAKYDPGFVPDLMIAAGGNGVDTCEGDSGGPLFLPPPGKVKFTPLQYGITSFGYEKCGGAHPSVYTEVNSPHIRSWIEHYRV